MPLTRACGSLFKLFLACFFLSCLMACASSSNKLKNASPEVLLKKAKQEFKKKDFDDAADLLKQLLEDFPDSPQRTVGQLLLADVLYRNGQYEEAKFNYQKFIELYPAHSRVEHAHYYKGMSDFKLIDIASRDQTPTFNALDQFEKLLEDFPKGKYRKRAEEKKDECLTMLATNILEIGKFYFRSGNYQSAIKRMNLILELYPNQKFSDEVMFLLAESYFFEQNYDEAQRSYKKLINKYPRSEFSKEARDRVREIR